MKTNVVFVFAMLLFISGIAYSDGKYDERNVVFSYKVFRHWAMVVGADSPSFTLYDHGKIIYQEMVNDNLVFKEATLSRDEFSELKKKLFIDEFLSETT